MSSFWGLEGRRPGRDEKADVAVGPPRAEPDALPRPQLGRLPLLPGHPLTAGLRERTRSTAPRWAPGREGGLVPHEGAAQAGAGRERRPPEAPSCPPGGVHRPLTLGSSEVRDLALTALSHMMRKPVPFPMSIHPEQTEVQSHG